MNLLYFVKFYKVLSDYKYTCLKRKDFDFLMQLLNFSKGKVFKNRLRHILYPQEKGGVRKMQRTNKET